MKSFLEFVNEKLNSDDILDLYEYFIKVLKMHEEHFHKEIKIATNQEFKAELNEVFDKINNEDATTEDLINLILRYEDRLYKKDLMCGEFGCSLWDLCRTITEEADKLNKNFSEKDIYKQNEEEYNSELSELDNKISDLDKQEKKLDIVYDLIRNAWDEAVEEYDDNTDKVLMSVIDKLLLYKKQYPEYAEDIQNEIDNILDTQSNKEDFE